VGLGTVGSSMFFSSILPYIFLLILRICAGFTTLGEDHRSRGGRQKTAVEVLQPWGGTNSRGGGPTTTGEHLPGTWRTDNCGRGHTTAKENNNDWRVSMGAWGTNDCGGAPRMAGEHQG
jgi:hypothetical protein